MLKTIKCYAHFSTCYDPRPINLKVDQKLPKFELFSLFKLISNFFHIQKQAIKYETDSGGSEHYLILINTVKIAFFEHEPRP